MNRNLIFVFILLAALCMVNAVPRALLKRDKLEFGQCPLPGDDTLIVIINPNPPVSNQPEDFTAGALATHAITANKTLFGIYYVDSSTQNPIGFPYFQKFNESYDVGDSFSIKATGVPTPSLTPSYSIFVVVGDPTGYPSSPIVIYDCALADSSGTNAAALAGFKVTLDGIYWP